MKQKRIIGRPWGRRRRGGWVIREDSLVNTLKMGDAVQLGDITVATKGLLGIIRSMDLLNDQLLLVRANGGLELETIGQRFVPNPEGPNPRKGVYYRLKQSLRHYIKLHDKAWIKGDAKTLVVLKPRKF